MEQNILSESTTPENTATTAVASVDLQSETSIAPGEQDAFSDRSDIWGVGPFRFHFRLANFLPGRGITVRHYGIAEATFLLAMAYFTSRGLGVVRQTLFNAIFGTGPEANAYYAAFRLPDTLFSLIAGGALIQAFVPVFITFEKDQGKRET
jgi:putative peptidoglycan lipid II flippase